MIPVTIHEADGTTHAITAPAGENLMRAAIDGGVDGILADCGGQLACATCHVYIAPEWLEAAGAPSPTEAAMLECALGRRENSRLSCQVILGEALAGMVVTLPDEQL